MSDLDEAMGRAAEVTRHLELASRSLRQAWEGVDRLSRVGHDAEEVLRGVEDQIARARLVPDEAFGVGDFVVAHPLEVLRQRCAAGADQAGEIGQLLGEARRQVTDARGCLPNAEDGWAGAPQDAVVVGLRLRVEQVQSLVQTATTLTTRVGRHLQEAATEAERLVPRALAGEGYVDAVWRVEQGTRTTGRLMVRADEGTRHLDRSVDAASEGADRSLGLAEEVARAARHRLQLGQQHPVRPDAGSGLPRHLGR